MFFVTRLAHKEAAFVLFGKCEEPPGHAADMYSYQRGS